ncbi:MAG: threonylcarbamoyl-AMP synthase [Clostridia bacterium]|nr:threonylcarbamoyl-AMP synthase [Clostridia bacterium]
METLIKSGKQAINLGADLIKAGEIVAFPTETVYGLGGNALDSTCVAKIYAAKGRPADNPLIVHIAKIEDIYPLVSEFSERNKKVVEQFMPGPITLLFPKSDIVPDSVTAGLKTVGIRMPKLKIAREFIESCGVPIAAPSANASTRVSPTTANHVFEDMKGRIPLIIDGGDSEVGIESTVLDLTGEIPTILRPGAITAEMLAEVIGSVRTHQGEVISSAPAPGMKYKHYAPTCPMVVAKDMDCLIAEYDKQTKNGLNVLALIRGQAIPNMGNRKYVNLGNTDKEVCRNIYKAMRDSEKVCDYIVCIDLGENGLCKSVMNRVLKASGGKVV